MSSRKGWSTTLWVGLKGAVARILGLRLIPGETTVETRLGIMEGHGQVKPTEGVCKVYPVDLLVTLPLGCAVGAPQEFDVAEKEGHSTLPMADLPIQPVR